MKFEARVTTVALNIISFCLLMPAVQARDLSQLESDLAAHKNIDSQFADELNADIEKLIQSDALKTASDFRRAGVTALIYYNNDLSSASRRYQLLITALAMGDPEAAKFIGSAWDQLIRSTGRPPRLFKRAGEETTADSMAPASIRNVFTAIKTGNKQSETSSAASNAEVQKIVDEDQACRKLDWSKFSNEQVADLAKSDRARLARMKEIIAEPDGLKTAADFSNAALVCQHGEYFLDYALAHELSLCSMLLGNKKASWLAGASYDRMLLHGSYLQRFDTQFGIGMKMEAYTSEGVNDTMRKAVVNRTISDSRALQKTK